MTVKLKGWLVVLLLGCTMVYALAEELTLTTYYPSPRGVYNELRTRGDVAIGKLDAPSARLEIVGGGATSATSALRIRNVDGTALLEIQNGGNIGIGTESPVARLDVRGGIKVGNTPTGQAGTIRWNDTEFQGFTGTAWVSFGVPAGTIAFFADSCPAGWSEMASVAGRVIVGLPPGGVIGATVGTALDNLENRTHAHAYSDVIAHTHSVSDPGHAHGFPVKNNIDSGGYNTISRAWPTGFDNLYQTHSSPTNISISATGVTTGTTNATSATMPYIQLRVCQKS